MRCLQRLLWLFRYQDKTQEQHYWESQKSTIRFFTFVWSFFCAGLVCSVMLRHIELETISRGIFAIPMCLALAPLILQCPRVFQMHVLHILCIAEVLFILWLSWSTTMHVQGAMHHLQEHDLSLVWEAVADLPEAKAQLESQLLALTADHIMWDHLDALYGTMCVLMFVGLNPYTTLTALLAPVVYFVGISIFGGNYVGFFHVAKLSGICLSFFVGTNLGVGFFRRSEFSVRYSFETKLDEALQSSRKADSILNHTLKNTMADASACLELYMARFQVSMVLPPIPPVSLAEGRGMGRGPGMSMSMA